MTTPCCMSKTPQPGTSAISLAIIHALAGASKEGKMAETPQQYTKRILSHSEGKDAVKVQKATPAKLAALTRKVKKAQLSKRPAPGKWSIAEILAHLADAELVVSFRMRLMLGANG